MIEDQKWTWTLSERREVCLNYSNGIKETKQALGNV